MNCVLYYAESTRSVAHFLEPSVDDHVPRAAGCAPLLLLLAVSRILTVITIVPMDRASQVLAQSLPTDVPKTWAALSERGGVPLTTLYYRAHRRQSMQEKAQGQQYLAPEEEKALITFLLLMSDLGQPVRVKYISSLAFSIARQRSIVSTDGPVKPPNKIGPERLRKVTPNSKREELGRWTGNVTRIIYM